MPRYFFHLHECGKVLTDLEGSEHASAATAIAVAVINARDVMAGELRAGRLCLGCHIVVTDETGSGIGTVKFADAVTVTGLAALGTDP